MEPIRPVCPSADQMSAVVRDLVAALEQVSAICSASSMLYDESYEKAQADKALAAAQALLVVAQPVPQEKSRGLLGRAWGLTSEGATR